MSHDAFQNGGIVQKPMFAPQGGKMGDDFDLNDLFADYLMTEADDPVNQLNLSMGAHAATLAQQQQQQAVVNAAAAAGVLPHHPGQAAAAALSQQAAPATAAAAPMPAGLPTGRGIKTAWHAGTAAAPVAPVAVQQVAAPIPASVPVPAPAPQSVLATEPVAKKIRVDEGLAAAMGAVGVGAGVRTPNVACAAVPSNATSAVPAATPAAPPPSGSALSGRLGFSMVGGQVAVPQKLHPQVVTPQQQQQQPQQAAAAVSSEVKPNQVSLPVGVGIRLGGQQQQQQAAAGVQMTHAQWSGAAAMGQMPGQPSAPGAVGGAAPGQFLMWGGMGGAAGMMGTGGMSEQAIAERRQRNREHAKRSRVRKKFMLESLQEQVRGLQKENELLRMLVQKRIPQHAQKIIGECCSSSPLFEDEEGVAVAAPAPDGEKKSTTELVKSDFSLIECLTSGQQNFVLSDPRLPDNPIVYASEGFYELTGYSREQVLGRNCRFLQGPGTDQKAVDVVRTAIANGTDATVCLLNYKADGAPFWNQFFVAALRDQDNCIVNYVGVQCEVEADAGATALEDKVNSVLPLNKKDDEEDGKDD